MRKIPDGLSEEKAARMMTALREGRTLAKFWVKASRLEAYFKSHPQYAREAIPLIAANREAAVKRKGLIWRERTKTMCLKGLHPMTGPNLLIDPATGRRRCKACHDNVRVGRPIPPAVIAKLKQALQKGITVNQICWGKPVGGGKIDRSLVIVNPAKFYHLRKLDRSFDLLVLGEIEKRISPSNPVHDVAAGTYKYDWDPGDPELIKAMLPENFPDKDAVINEVIISLLEGRLDRGQIASRIRWYLKDYYRAFPIKYAKFGRSRLVSLDEVMFDGGSMTRGDMVSRGLWD